MRYENVIEMLSEGVKVYVAPYSMKEIEEAIEVAKEHGFDCKFENDYIVRV